MNINKLVRASVKKYKIDVPESVIRKIVSTLKVAGNLPYNIMMDLIKQELDKYNQTIQATKNTTTGNTTDVYANIDTAFKSGNCPLCGKPMTDVKLADYTPAKYCTNNCRVTLWSN